MLRASGATHVDKVTCAQAAAHVLQGSSTCSRCRCAIGSVDHFGAESMLEDTVVLRCRGSLSVSSFCATAGVARPADLPMPSYASWYHCYRLLAFMFTCVRHHNLLPTHVVATAVLCELWSLCTHQLIRTSNCEAFLDRAIVFNVGACWNHE
jgi:hypothetical protein